MEVWNTDEYQAIVVEQLIFTLRNVAEYKIGCKLIAKIITVDRKKIAD
jgi:hypothetical protein